MEYTHGTQKEKEKQAQFLRPCHVKDTSKEASIQAQVPETQQRYQEPLDQGVGINDLVSKLNNSLRALEDLSHDDYHEQAATASQALLDLKSLEQHLATLVNCASNINDEDNKPHSWKP